jgi:hypothetical protein
MKNIICLFSVAAILASAPAFAKIDPDFPSRSIRPMVSASEADRNSGQVSYERRVAPTQERTTQRNPRSCAKPFVGRDEADTADRRECQPENSVSTQSDIPQLRAFRQPSTQRFAP